MSCVGLSKRIFRFMFFEERSRDRITWYHVIQSYHAKVLVLSFIIHIKLFTTIYKPLRNPVWKLTKISKNQENPVYFTTTTIGTSKHFVHRGTEICARYPGKTKRNTDKSPEIWDLYMILYVPNFYFLEIRFCSIQSERFFVTTNL